jgi:hypothetical protein
MPTATLLRDGRVLVLGGGPERTSMVIWDPTTGAFTPTGPLRAGRAGRQTATLLPDGSVLIVGGFSVTVLPAGDIEVTALRTVEVWDPVTGDSHEAPPLPTGRYDHTTTLLPDGRIIVAGGMVEVPGAPTQQVASDEVLIRDPVSGVFHAAGRLAAPRSGHDAALLPQGDVLLVGGDELPGAGTIESWHPNDGTSSLLSPASVRLMGVATQLPDGTLLLSGGMLPVEPGSSPSMALDLEVYDPIPGR